MRSLRTPAIVAVLALFAVALGLAACGEKSEDGGTEAQPLSPDARLLSQPRPRRDLHGARSSAISRKPGSTSTIQTPSDPAAPIKLVAAGQSDLAISYEPEVALAHEKGLDVVAIGALVNRPLTSMIWLRKSGIKGVADLRGKTIATAGIPYQDAFLETILARADLTPSDVKTVNVGFGLLPALLGGSADAMLGGFRNVEGVDLRLRGKDPVVTPVDQLGVPTYDELVLVANREQLEEDPEKFRLFLAALERGTDAAVKQPERGDQGDARGERRPRPETDRGRGRSDAAAARRAHAGQPYG